MSEAALPKEKRPLWTRNPLVDFCLKQPAGAVALLVLIIMLLAGVFAERIAPYDPVRNNLASMLQPPSWTHLLGTDPFGRDILTRIIYGARTALIIGLSSAFLGCTIGAIIGAASAYFGGPIDNAIQRGIDLLLSFPLIVLALVVVAVLGRWLIFGVDINLIFAIAIPIVPQVARVIRSSALVIRNLPYVDAARIAGYSNTRIVLRHMIPNLMAPYLIMLTAYVAQAILLEAVLSFLGLGVAEPVPAWGLMLSGSASDFFEEAPWIVIFPGLAISLAVFAFNLLGDALRDWLDPKFKT
ncbi:ABC transporter permease [Pseudorhodoplanes sinuspersici]|uniref:ABC transporter permease n=1 Tax=Pseudorhodoplanes sinuspersici TaxID=1235591 RepID=A0A1W6ZSB1_9HYPH|nr:ABC transporter permease [Pseudorhodoplanes sinuspersici]ARP99634.1 ABC transporter permease [Pseudorhodoplanes sinuspersici]RKE70608.1 peptide/nickel transport system permease protein [Pseudorhodoplanes sinuspersici]